MTNGFPENTKKEESFVIMLARPRYPVVRKEPIFGFEAFVPSKICFSSFWIENRKFDFTMLEIDVDTLLWLKG